MLTQVFKVKVDTVKRLFNHVLMTKDDDLLDKLDKTKLIMCGHYIFWKRVQ